MTQGTDEADREPAPSTAARLLRPFGYLLTGLIWLALWLVVVALGPGVIVFLLVDGTFSFESVADNQSPASWIAAGVFMIPIAVVIWGPVVGWWMPCSTWPLAALAFLYVARSLRPSYAAERLSFSRMAPRGTTLGPPTLYGTSLSLQPVRRTRYANVLMAFYLSGWNPDGRAMLAMLPAGGAFVLAFPAVAVDVTMGVRGACAVLAVGLVVWSLLRVSRAWYQRFWGAQTTIAGAGESVPWR